MELNANEVIEEYKRILSETNHQLLLATLSNSQKDRRIAQLEKALGAPQTADLVPVGPRVPAAPANPPQTS
jgi:hypothetical protein